VSSYQKLKILVNELHCISSSAQRRSIAVSEASVGWHIAHSYLVIVKSCENLLGNASSPSQNPKWLRQEIFFILRRIPRNKIKAPEFVIPTDYSEKEINRLYHKAISLIEQIEKLKSGYLFHPFLGPIKLRRVPLFLRIHTAHHLQIIREMIK